MPFNNLAIRNKGGTEVISNKPALQNRLTAAGSNFFGDLGDGTGINRSSPVLILGNFNFVKSQAGSGFTLALTVEGDAYSWGNNTNGQLGNGTSSSTNSPAIVVGNHKFQSIHANSSSSYGLDKDGKAWGWGNGSSGQLGLDSTPSEVFSPTEPVGNHTFTRLALGVNHTLSVKENGEAWSWGNNANGKLGDDNIINRSSPVLVVGTGPSLVIFKEVTASIQSSFAIDDQGRAWSWGSNDNGILGLDSDIFIEQASPVLVVGSHSFVKIKSYRDHVLALKENGEVWSWGRNQFGQLGDGTQSNRSSPVLVTGGHLFVDIAVGATYSVAVKSDGTAWTWGLNSSGQLADNTTLNRSSPVQVTGNKRYVNVGAGLNTTFIGIIGRDS